MKIEILDAIPLQNEWDSWHWSKQRKYKRELAFRLRYSHEAGVPAFWRRHYSAVRIHVVRHSGARGGPLPDVDAVSTKALLDVLQVPRGRLHPYGLGVIENDSRDVIRELVVDVARGEPRTVIEIEPIEETKVGNVAKVVLEVGVVYSVTNGGGPLQARIETLTGETLTKQRVGYRLRNSTRGPFRRQVHEVSRRKFLGMLA